MKTVSWEKHKKELMSNPEFMAEYKKLEPEFALARQVIEARIQRKMTQSELAKKAKTNQVVISRLESGMSNPRLDTIAKVSNALGKKVEIKFIENTRF